MLRVRELMCPDMHRHLEGHGSPLWEVTEGHSERGQHREAWGKVPDGGVPQVQAYVRRSRSSGRRLGSGGEGREARVPGAEGTACSSLGSCVHGIVTCQQRVPAGRAGAGFPG